MRREWLSTILKSVVKRSPLTPLGCAVALGAYGGYTHWGRGSSDFVIVAAAVGVAAIFAVSLVSVSIAAILLRRDVQRNDHDPRPAAIQVGQSFTDNFRFLRFAYWPIVQTSVAWVNPSKVNVEVATDGPHWVESVRPQVRGRWKNIERRFTVTDIFGLVKWTIDHSTAARVRVAPQAMPVDLKIAFLDGAEDGYAHPHGAPIGDFIELRRYSPGDPLKNVLWKAYARTGKLFVRTPENALDVLPSTAAYFIAGIGDEPSASLARALLQERLLGDDLLFAADGREDVARTPEAALDLVIDSADYRGAGGDGLRAFGERMRRDRVDRCLLIVPNHAGSWMPAVAQFMTMTKFPPLVISAVDQLPAPRHARLPEWLFVPPPREKTVVGNLGAVAKGIHQLGCELRVVDGRSGQILNATQMQSLERV